MQINRRLFRSWSWFSTGATALLLAGGLVGCRASEPPPTSPTLPVVRPQPGIGKTYQPPSTSRPATTTPRSSSHSSSTSTGSGGGGAGSGGGGAGGGSGGGGSGGSGGGGGSGSGGGGGSGAGGGGGGSGTGVGSGAGTGHVDPLGDPSKRLNRPVAPVIVAPPVGPGVDDPTGQPQSPSQPPPQSSSQPQPVATPSPQQPTDEQEPMPAEVSADESTASEAVATPPVKYAPVDLDHSRLESLPPARRAEVLRYFNAMRAASTQPSNPKDAQP